MNFDILEKYNIKESKINKVNQGYINDVWDITTLENRFILKRFNKVDKEKLNYLLSIEDSLLNLCPNIIKNISGELCTELDNTELYVLYEFVIGRHLNRSDVTPELAKDIGGYLGKLHKKLFNIGQHMDKNYLSSLHISAPKINEITELLEENSNEKSCARLLKNKLKILGEFDYNEINSFMSQLPLQIVHGDFYLDNLIYTKNNEWKIIDFEQSGLFYKEYEIARVLFMICYNNDDTEQYNFEKVSMFLDGYKESNDISDLKNVIKLFLYSLANSLYCFKDWENLSLEKREYALYRNNMMMWIYDNLTNIVEYNGKNDK